MSEYIDILCHKADEKSTFTVDTTGPLFVNVSAGSSLKMYAGENSKFARYDNFRLLSVGIALPESFTFSQVVAGGTKLNTGILVEISGWDVTNASTFSLPFSGGGGAILVPLENYEMPLDVFVNMENLKAVCSGPFQILASITVLDSGTYPRVSMVGVPAALNATVQSITLFMKILHNSPLSA
jgi:hypothetical protein